MAAQQELFSKLNTPAAVLSQVDRIARLPEVLELVGVGRTTLYNMIRDGRFPAPLHLSTRIRGWRLSTIDQFLTSAGGK